MPFFTRPNFEDRQQVQYSGDTITLSGKTHINTTGYLHINAPLLDFTGSTSASTQYVLAGLSGYRNYGELTSLIVQPPIKLYSGTSATTTVNVTGYILGGLDAQGHVSWFPASYFLTGGTGGGGTGTTYVYVQFTGNTSATCITDLYVQNLNSCSPLYIQNVSIGDVIISPYNNGNVAIGHLSASTKLDISGKTKTIQLQVTDGAVNGYVLTSDSVGNATWQPAPVSSGGTSVFSGSTSPYKFGPNTYDIVTLSGNNFTLSNGSLVLGGLSNITQGNASTIINGQSNTITGSPKSTIINGNTHFISNAQFSTIINGDTNTIDGPILPSTYSFIGGGNTNRISNSTNSIIGNGNNNIIDISGLPGIGNTILNGVNNTIDTLVIHSTIVGGTDNYTSAAYTFIAGGSGNRTTYINSNILGSSITATAVNTTYTELLTAGASSVNSYQGHLNVNDYNTVGPIRPNYITELLTSGNTTGGTYNIYIPSGWVVEDVQVYLRTSDASIFGATISTAGAIWDASTPTPFTPSHNIITLFRTVSQNGPHYFSSPDLLTVNFVNAGAIPQTLTTGEYKVLITYWNGNEVGIF